MEIKNTEYNKLSPVPNDEGTDEILEILADQETVFAAFKSARDFIVFTNKRAVIVHKTGVRGDRKKYSSLPYNKLQTFTVTTCGSAKLECEFELFYSAFGRARFEIKGEFDVLGFNQLLSGYVL